MPKFQKHSEYRAKPTRRQRAAESAKKLRNAILHIVRGVFRLQNLVALNKCRDGSYRE